MHATFHTLSFILSHFKSLVIVLSLQQGREGNKRRKHMPFPAQIYDVHTLPAETMLTPDTTAHTGHATESCFEGVACGYSCR